MMAFALLLAGLAGALASVLICKGITLRLWADVAAGMGAVLGVWASAMLAGSDPWPLWGFWAGYAAVVVYLRRAAS
jgi:hypothetical protein